MHYLWMNEYRKGKARYSLLLSSKISCVAKWKLASRNALMGTHCLKLWNLSNWSYQALLPCPSTLLVWSLFLSSRVLFIYYHTYINGYTISITRSDSFTLFLHITGATESVKKAYDALLLDAGGTLLQLTRPVEEIYASIGRKYGFFPFLFMLLLLLFYVGDNMLFLDESKVIGSVCNCGSLHQNNIFYFLKFILTSH